MKGRADRLVLSLGLLLLFSSGLLWSPHSASLRRQAPSPISSATYGSYATNFAATENPISEGGKWISGKSVGLDWSDVATTPGLAFGTQSGTESGAKRYDDSTALLTGAWGPDQTVEATVHTVNQNDSIYEEVELRLRSSLSSHQATGYEINFRCSKTANAYAQIVRWDGPVGRFTYLNDKRGPQYGIADGDVVMATIQRNVITAYINGVQVLQAADDTYTGGSPGMGFYLEKTPYVNRDYGFTSFKASDTK